ncbi:MAG: uracil-DNA glycosylase [Anaerolineales bacterium]|jgi:uracil-DNA glycosylase family 4
MTLPQSMPPSPSWEALDQTVIACRTCARLVAWREQVALTKRRAYMDEDYWGKPVPGFGDRQARVLVVGLAPGAHGANRTGRMFTGDSSGDFLFQALHTAGFASQPFSRRGDELKLYDLYISAVCRCVPPGNKPTGQEIANCLPYLAQEINFLDRLRVVVALGHIAFDGVRRVYRQRGLELSSMRFAHGATFTLGPEQPVLIASYHPSRQNTQTGRLTPEMFSQIWELVRTLSTAG